MAVHQGDTASVRDDLADGGSLADATGVVDYDEPYVPPTRKVEQSRTATFPEVCRLLLPIGAMLVALGLTLLVPTIYPVDYAMKYYPTFLGVSIAAWGIASVVACVNPKVRAKMTSWSYLVFAVYILLLVLDMLTLKSGVLRLPFAPSPDRILTAVPANLESYWENFLASAALLAEGIFFGLISGFATGVLMGWSRIANYWFTPLLKFLGPIPSAAWLPIAVVLTPSTHLAGVLLIAVAVWFPLALMLSGAIRSTDKRKIDAARIMGASEFYILVHVALPAAVPDVFNALFMGLSSSFGALIVSEQLGVKAGLGWYISWAEAWGEYYKVFATVGIFIILFYVIMNILFRVRDHVMKWQKSVVRW